MQLLAITGFPFHSCSTHYVAKEYYVPLMEFTFLKVHPEVCGFDNLEYLLQICECPIKLWCVEHLLNQPLKQLLHFGGQRPLL